MRSRLYITSVGAVHSTWTSPWRAISLMCPMQRNISSEHGAIDSTPPASTSSMEVYDQGLPSWARTNRHHGADSISFLPSQYSSLTAFVLDNSVTMRWCFQNTSTPYLLPDQTRQTFDVLEQHLPANRNPTRIYPGAVIQCGRRSGPP